MNDKYIDDFIKKIESNSYNEKFENEIIDFSQIMYSKVDLMGFVKYINHRFTKFDYLLNSIKLRGESINHVDLFTLYSVNKIGKMLYQAMKNRQINELNKYANDVPSYLASQLTSSYIYNFIFKNVPFLIYINTDKGILPVIHYPNKF